ncbi:nitric oxide synthase-interacting protein homolog [Camellia sinensis]|uniref:nitric oxide synthase-interacting protein homolog n=1 Tax=Camellia sinensis TaxID=4442 RepID=UPI001035ECB3|nr:nitric oxide synthase-interacting protein homolog [Camellia sinensis]
MTDEKPIGEQIHEFQELLRGAEKSGTIFSEDFKVSCLIDKLPPSWTKFAQSLRHKQGELTLTQTLNSLRVEEKHRASLPKPLEKPPKVNLIENKNSSNNNNSNNKNFNKNFNNRPRNFNNRNNFKPRGTTFKTNRFNPNRNQAPIHQSNDKLKGIIKGSKHCFVYGRMNHVAKDCYFKKIKPVQYQRNLRDQVNMPPTRVGNKYFVTFIDDSSSEITNNTILESRDATFFKHVFPFKMRISSQVNDVPSTSDNPVSSTSMVQGKEVEPQGLRRSKGTSIEKNLGKGFYKFLIEGEPTTYNEAMTSIDAPFWKEAINSEIESILQNNTWGVVNLPLGNKAIGCKWIF